MADILTSGFGWFAYETGILGEMRQYQWMEPQVLIALGILACFFGFYCYRSFFSTFLFMLIAVICSVLLRGHTDWGSITTCFTVLGVSIGFIGWFWSKLGACVLCGLLGGAVGWAIYPSLWPAVLPGIAAVALTLTFPVLSVKLMTSVSGIWILWDMAVLGDMGAHLYYAVPVLAAGFALQTLMSRKQKVFEKVRPDRVTYWLEERERKLKNVDGVPEGN